MVAAATIFIASKLVEPCPVAGTTLVKYTDNTYQLTELLEMELVILSRLKWDLSALTPNAFLEHLLKIISDENSFLERDLMKDIKQIERAKEATRSSNSTYQAVCNQRSEHAKSTVSQQQQQKQH